MALSETDARERLDKHGQAHVLRFWDRLDEADRKALLEQIDTIQFPLIERLIEKWVKSEPSGEHYENIDPVPVIPPIDGERDDAKEAFEAGEKALRGGKVGIVMVAGGQGTRLGYDGPKGAYPIGPITEKTIFEYHAEKIRNLQRRYGCTLPWYIMVSDANDAETRAFFEEHDYFGLGKDNVTFFQQRMVPCVDEEGYFMLDEPGKIAMNPNGHGGTIPALVENGIVDDAKKRGITTLSYLQVDNWAVKIADPYFIGYHILRNSEFSSKVHRKTEPRESVGVHCKCDGEYRVIEYSELDIYPQLLEQKDDGSMVHFAGNPAIHAIDVDFIQRVFNEFDSFPWHRAHKKVPYVDENGKRIEPEKPNAYKFETFIFDALQFVKNEPMYLEIYRRGEYTPIKQFDGPNSVVAAREAMAEMWANWLEAAGHDLPRDNDGKPKVDVEISPDFALTKEEFLEKANDLDLPKDAPVAIDANGKVLAAK